jgi:hypothetical protein
MILPIDVNRVREPFAAEALAMGGIGRADFSDDEGAGVIPAVLVQNTAAASRRLDPHDAVIQQSRSAVRVTVVDQQRDLQRPHAVADAALHVVFLQPVPAGPGVALVDTDALATRANLFKGLDDGVGRVGVIVDAANLTVVDGTAVAGSVHGSVVGEDDTGMLSSSGHDVVLLWLKFGRMWRW